MKSLTDLLAQVFCREPSTEENILQLRSAARKVSRYSPRIASNLRAMADAEEEKLRDGGDRDAV
jgi:hypothetical protein